MTHQPQIDSLFYIKWIKKKGRFTMFHLKNEKNTKWEQLRTVLQWIDEAEAIVVGGASGMSTACGFDYYSHHTPFFQKYFSDFGEIWIYVNTLDKKS